MEVRKKGLRLGKVPFTDIAWVGELTRDLKKLTARKSRLLGTKEHLISELERYELNYIAEKKEFVTQIQERQEAMDGILLGIEEHEKEIAKYTPKKKVKKPKPEPEKIPEHIITPKKPAPVPSLIPEPIKESLKETIEEITEEIIEHQERTITEVKKAINGEFTQTIIEGKILCPECIQEGKQKEDSLFTKGGAFIAHYKSHFKNGNGDGD